MPGGIVNPSLNQLFDKVLSVPGAAELLKPTIDVPRKRSDQGPFELSARAEELNGYHKLDYSRRDCRVYRR
jgi:hypothetical protein